jgi:hypothetical protein
MEGTPLPLIDASDLTRAQRQGKECVSCFKRFPRPTVPVGRTGAGDILYRCPECEVVLEYADDRPVAVPVVATKPGAHRR